MLKDFRDIGTLLDVQRTQLANDQKRLVALKEQRNALGRDALAVVGNRDFDVIALWYRRYDDQSFFGVPYGIGN